MFITTNRNYDGNEIITRLSRIYMAFPLNFLKIKKTLSDHITYVIFPRINSLKVWYAPQRNWRTSKLACKLFILDQLKNLRTAHQRFFIGGLHVWYKFVVVNRTIIPLSTYRAYDFLRRKKSHLFRI